MNRRSFLALLLSSPALHAAPAPLSRRQAPDQVTPGVYVLHWLGGPWAVVLSADGNYSARSGSLEFVGSWGWDARGRVLLIRERPSYCVGGYATYEIPLDRALRGRQPGGEVRLERAR